MRLPQRLAQRVVAYVRAHLDGIGALLAFLYGLPSLGYAFGRDQAIFCYVGREWVAGRLPYAEAFDIKPPGIYAVYALAGELFGFQMWSIRLVELAAVLLLGLGISLAVRRDQPPARGEMGAMMLLGAGFYYTVFDYWDTGQVEFWESLFALLGYLAAERVRKPFRAAVAAGLLGGTAAMFKTPIVVVLPVAGCVVVARAYLETEGTWLPRARSAAIAFVLHCATGCSVVALVIGYFTLRGGWPALIELAGYTATYVQNTQVPADSMMPMVLWFWGVIGRRWLSMLATSLVLGVVLAARRRSLRAVGGAGIALLLTFTATLSVWAQLKFWPYHWVVAAPFMLLCAAYGIAELGRWRSALLLPVALVATLLGYYDTPRWTANEAVSYHSYTPSFWSYVRGEQGRTSFLKQFVGPFFYNSLDSELVGNAIGDRAQPGDRLHVRGFEPAIYITARLASPSRFASEAPLLSPELSYKRDIWLAEHDKALWDDRPRFLVTFDSNLWDIEVIKSRAYHQLGQFGRFLYFERDEPPLPPPGPAR